MSLKWARGTSSYGTLYVIAILLLVFVIGLNMIGGVSIGNGPDSGTPVTIVTFTPAPGKSVLQLYNFGYVTGSPSAQLPTATPTP